jgi:hypothetical protein
MQLIPILIEVYHDKAPALPVPVAAYGSGYDEERIVLLVYEDEIREAA